MKHTFLSDSEISQILEKLQKKRTCLEKDIEALKASTIPPEREKAGSADGVSYSATIDEVNSNKKLLETDQKKLTICNEAITALMENPSTFGFDPWTGNPFPTEYLLRVLFINECKPVVRQKLLVL